MDKVKCILMFLIVGVVLASGVVSVEADSRYYDPNESLSILPGNGTAYYVDGTSGNDSWNGRYANYQGGADGPYKTIGKAIYRYSPKGAGDRVLIKAGRYYTRLSIGYSYGGEEGNPFMIGPYGDGEVIIDNSVSYLLGEWLVYNSNIYKSTISVDVFNVIIDDDFKKYHPQPDLASVIKEGDWYYDSVNDLLYVHTAGDNPSDNDVIVTESDGDSSAKYGVYIEHADYITLYGLTIQGSPSIGIYSTRYNDQGGTNIRIEKCKVQYHGKSSILFEGLNNELIKNWIHGNVMFNWPRGRMGYANAGGFWPTNINVGSAVNASGNIISDGGGEGLASYGGSGNNILEDNIISNSFSVNVYIDNQPNSIIRRNLIYCEDPSRDDLYTDGVSSGDQDSMFRRLRGEGIMTGDEDYGKTPPANFRNATITNNIILGCRRGFNHYPEAEGSGLKDVLFAYNTIIVPNALGVGESFIGVQVSSNGGNNNNSFFRNNIIYASHPNTYLFYGSGTIGSDTIPGVLFDHNIWYHTSRSDAFHLGPTYHTTHDTGFDGWKAKLISEEIGSLFADPMLTDVSGYNPGDMVLLSDSPAIDTGILGMDYDFYSNPRPQGVGYDIGALEHIITQTCSDAIGTCCSSGQTCEGGSFTSSSDCGGLCCLGTCTEIICVDGDGDGYNQSQVGCGVADCNDINQTIYPGATEICGNGVDEDCSGSDLTCNDTISPIISNLSSTPASTSATVTWNTNEPATSIVEYGLTTSYGYSVAVLSFVVSHWVSLIGLESGTLYYYRVGSSDESGNNVSSSDGTFTTTASGDGGGSSGGGSSSTECVLTNAYWSVASAVEGQQVLLMVEGTNCDREEIDLFVIWEDDLIGDDSVNENPSIAGFSDGIAVSTWTAEYQDDFFGDPEYYFISRLKSDSSIKVDSRSYGELLKVSAAGGRGIYGCPDYVWTGIK